MIFDYSENELEPQNVILDEDAILRSNFKPDKSSKILIHGFESNTNKELQEIKNAYIIKRTFNIWMVDWEKLATGFYPVVVTNLNHAGSCVADFIKFLLNFTSTSFRESLHVIGHSLGAHVAAYTANHLEPYKLPRITGLDPALSFLAKNFNTKLSKKSAKFVDVVHTDALLQGKMMKSGHTDFFMNGGLIQPGCWNKHISEFVRCNHHRAITYFAESITSEIGFWGWPCRSFFHYLIRKCPPQTPTVLMGEYCEPNTRGYYIIITASKKPFAIGRNFSKNEQTRERTAAK